MIQVEQLFARLGIENCRSHGNPQDDVRRPGSVLVGSASIFTVFRPVQASVAVVDQCIDVTVGHRMDAAAATAIAAVRAALGYEFFAAKACRAVADRKSTRLHSSH